MATWLKVIPVPSLRAQLDVSASTAAFTHRIVALGAHSAILGTVRDVFRAGNARQK